MRKILVANINKFNPPLLSSWMHFWFVSVVPKNFKSVGYYNSVLHYGDNAWLSVLSGFRRDVDEFCVLLGYYAASNGNPFDAA
jgi:hypothetical protein